MKKLAVSLGCVGLFVLPLWIKFRIDNRGLVQARPTPPVTLESAEFESNSLRRFSLGYDNVIADLLWIRLLQNATHERLLEAGVSWEYAQLNAMTELDPNYERAYYFGSAYLTVFRRDRLGAKRILEKWVQRRPIYWRARYLLGFHLYSEMQDYQGASEHILKAARLANAPDWLSALGLRLMSEEGSYFPALQIALELFPSLPAGEGKNRLRARIRSLRYHIQQFAWRNALASYRKQRGADPSSIEELQSAAGSRELAQVEAGAADDEELRELLRETFRFRYDREKREIVGILKPEDSRLERTGIYRIQN